MSYPYECYTISDEGRKTETLVQCQVASLTLRGSNMKIPHAYMQ